MEIHHGTLSGYTNQRCRCSECKATFAEYQRRRRSNPDVAEREKANQRKRYALDAEKHRARNREFYSNNAEYFRKYRQEQWLIPAQRDRILSWNQNRRARKRDAFVEHVEVGAVYERDNWVCHICGGKVDCMLKHPDPMCVSLDHIVPLSKGGEHSYINCATAHLRCNIQKQAKC